MRYKIAGVIFEINPKYAYADLMLKKYKTDKPGDAVVIDVTDEDISSSVKLDPSLTKSYHESLVLYRKICEYMSLHGFFMMHASVVSLDRLGYAFAAQSGTGKTTHSLLWRECFGAKIINGDKPLFTYDNGRFYAYGTPWCGKEYYNENRRVKMKAVCFLHRSKKNTIRRLSASEVISKIFDQVYLPQSTVGKERVLELLDKFITNLPFYSLGCDISREAALLSMRTMTGKAESEEK